MALLAVLNHNYYKSSTELAEDLKIKNLERPVNALHSVADTLLVAVRKRWFCVTLPIALFGIALVVAVNNPTLLSTPYHDANMIISNSTTGKTKFGFLLQFHDNSRQAESVIRRLRVKYPASSFPIFVFTDSCTGEGGGKNFTTLCEMYDCTWLSDGLTGGYGAKHTDPINGYIFFQRVLRAIRMCKCEYLVWIERDTCLHRQLTMEDFRPPLDGDIGGVPWPDFPSEFLKTVNEATRTTVGSELQSAVWGCTAGCYYRSDFFIEREHEFTLEKLFLAAKTIPIHYLDVVGPAFTLMAGGKVKPWHAVSERGAGADPDTGVKVAVEDPLSRPFEHACEPVEESPSFKDFPTCVDLG